MLLIMLMVMAATEHIVITPENRKKLDNIGNTNDSYNDVITKLLKNQVSN